MQRSTLLSVLSAIGAVTAGLILMPQAHAPAAASTTSDASANPAAAPAKPVEVLKAPVASDKLLATPVKLARAVRVKLCHKA
jgi:hypothetical protein